MFIFPWIYEYNPYQIKLFNALLSQAKRTVSEVIDEEEIKTKIDESIDFESDYYLDRFMDESKID